MATEILFENNKVVIEVNEVTFDSCGQDCPIKAFKADLVTATKAAENSGKTVQVDQLRRKHALKIDGKEGAIDLDKGGEEVIYRCPKGDSGQLFLKYSSPQPIE